MIKIEHPVFPSPEQWMFSIEGARNAYDSWSTIPTTRISTPR